MAEILRQEYDAFGNVLTIIWDAKASEADKAWAREEARRARPGYFRIDHFFETPPKEHKKGFVDRRCSGFAGMFSRGGA